MMLINNRQIFMDISLSMFNLLICLVEFTLSLFSLSLSQFIVCLFVCLLQSQLLINNSYPVDKDTRK